MNQWKIGGEFLPYHPDASHVAPGYRDGWNACYEAAMAERERVTQSVARPLAEWEWHEDDGPALWWAFPIGEAPWVGRPIDDDWPGYHTHWTPLPPPPTEPESAP